MKSKSYLLSTPESLQKEQSRLIKQAEVLFRIEEEVLKEIVASLSTQVRVLDLGCGNGAYLTAFIRRFCDSTCFGFERNPKLINQAQTLNSSLKIIEGDLSDQNALANCIRETKPNYINLRFVLQHMTEVERAQLMTFLSKHAPISSKIVIVEVDDSAISMNSESALIKGLIHRAIKIQAARGGNRTLGGQLGSELQKLGINNVKMKKVYLSKRKNGIEHIIELFLPIWGSYSENDNKTVIDEKIKHAAEWLRAQDSDFDIIFPIYIFAIEPTGL